MFLKLMLSTLFFSYLNSLNSLIMNKVFFILFEKAIYSHRYLAISPYDILYF